MGSRDHRCAPTYCAHNAYRASTLRFGPPLHRAQAPTSRPQLLLGLFFCEQSWLAPGTSHYSIEGVVCCSRPPTGAALLSVFRNLARPMPRIEIHGMGS